MRSDVRYLLYHPCQQGYSVEPHRQPTTPTILTRNIQEDLEEVLVLRCVCTTGQNIDPKHAVALTKDVAEPIGNGASVREG